MNDERYDCLSVYFVSGTTIRIDSSAKVLRFEISPYGYLYVYKEDTVILCSAPNKWEGISVEGTDGEI